MAGPSAGPEVVVVLATFAVAVGCILPASWSSYRRSRKCEMRPSRRHKGDARS